MARAAENRSLTDMDNMDVKQDSELKEGGGNTFQVQGAVTKACPSRDPAKIADQIVPNNPNMAMTSILPTSTAGRRPIQCSDFN